MEFFVFRLSKLCVTMDVLEMLHFLHQIKWKFLAYQNSYVFLMAEIGSPTFEVPE